jgi:Tol biopolymer transport system component
VWSPDGRYLFFSSNRGGSVNLWRIPLDEKSGKVLGPAEPVTTPSSNAGFMSFARDGSRMAYVHQTFARNFSKFRFDRPAEPPTPITRGAHIYRQLDLSPDGQSIAYATDSRVFIMAVDGTNVRPLSDARSSRGPRWSPDGTRIAFYSNRSDTNQVWTIQADGTDLRQVTNHQNSKGVYYPVWSPDGKTITCTSLEGLTLTVDLTKALNQKPDVLPPFPNPGMSFVAWLWSPDGSALAGWKLLPDGKSAGIAIYDAGTRRYRDLTSLGIYPTWIKNGNALLFAANEKLHTVDVGSGTVADVPTPAGFANDFSLAKDGRWLHYAEDQREGDVWLVTLAPGTTTREPR